jgi:flagellar FliL protein
MSKDVTTTPPTGKSKKKLLLLMLAALLLAGAGGAGYFGFLRGPKTPPKPEPGKVVPLDAITMNLAEGHFLKLRLALQATADVAEAPDGSKALDIAITEFSNRSVGDLSSNAAREKAKSELKDKVGKAYNGKIMNVYLTEFVMQ